MVCGPLLAYICPKVVKAVSKTTHDPKDPWTVLGIPPTTDRLRVRQAYLEQVRRHHPDPVRQDPARFRQQEERMKDINRAYHDILTGQAACPPATPEAAVVCPLHGRPAQERCGRCRTPLCSQCPGVRMRQCARHHRRTQIRIRRRQAARDWSLLILAPAALRAIGLNPARIVETVVGYLVLLGFGELRRTRSFGCLVWLLFPYSLVFAGLYRLYRGLTAFGRSGT